MGQLLAPAGSGLFPWRVIRLSRQAYWRTGQDQPISYGFSFDHRNKLPYSEHYELSIQRQLGSSTVMSASYVGNQGHRLVTSIEANPANPALCLFLNDP